MGGGKDRAFRPLLVSVFFTFYLFSFQICSAVYNITRSRALSPGQTLLSPDHVFEFGFFTSNNSQMQYVGIWYNQSPRVVVWVANREKPITITDYPASLTIADDGNLELLDGDQNSVWSTNVRVASNSSVVVLSDSGNLVLQDAESEEDLWQSFDHLGDTFLTGAVFGFNTKTGEKKCLSSWKSESDPSPGNFTAELSQERPPQIFVLFNGSSPRWRSGPWNRLRFTGMPGMGISYETPFNLDEDDEKGTTYLSFKSYNTLTKLKMFLSSEGILEIMSKEAPNDWYSNCVSPSDPCEVYATCGPFGLCKVSKLDPICKCLKGFVPKSHEEWSKGNWTGGCVRETQLLCEKSNVSSVASQEAKKDAFVKLEKIKLPNFHEYVKDLVAADRCQALCLNNCSCLAYAFVTGIGCLVWSERLIDIQGFSDGGEDIFVRVAHSEIVGGHSSKKITISVSAASSVATLSLIVFISLCRWRTTQKRKVDDMKELDFIHSRSYCSGSSNQSSEQRDRSEFPTFFLNSILAATDYFSTNNKLGQGGYGPVYKGKLKDGTEIAVKRLSSSSGQGTEEFMNEMSLISKLQHRNLVRLIGCCVEKEEKLLVYEFMPNKSLDYFIFDPKGREQLDWATRFNIIHGVARGLVYLHRDSCLRVIHRDLKVSNILLDEKMNPKISDFGLARIFQGTLDLANTRRIVGTLSYMSPEYAIGGIFSEKSDVFSFGVLILEIISGRKNASFLEYDQHQSLIAYAWHLWSEGRGLLDTVDKALGDSYSSADATRCIHVGLLCVQDHAIDRPTMPEVISMLSNEADLPHPKQPPFTFQSFFGSESQQQSNSKCSTNEVTISKIEGR